MIKYFKIAFNYELDEDIFSLIMSIYPGGFDYKIRDKVYAQLQQPNQILDEITVGDIQ